MHYSLIQQLSLLTGAVQWLVHQTTDKGIGYKNLLAKIERSYQGMLYVYFIYIWIFMYIIFKIESMEQKISKKFVIFKLSFYLFE